MLTLFIAIVVQLSFCTQKNSNKHEQIIDSVKVIESGVGYIYKTVRFADDYYTNPLKIVKSENVPLKISFMLNGLKTELVNEKPSAEVINNWKHPQPYLEVLKIKKEKDRILLQLLFRTTGNEYTIWLKDDKLNNLKIDSLSHSKI